MRDQCDGVIIDPHVRAKISCIEKLPKSCVSDNQKRGAQWYDC